LARNRYSGNSEMAGSCFAPSHSTLFVNIQNPGITLAISGPWDALRSGE
jgi:secreted PhoX family phosphatase